MKNMKMLVRKGYVYCGGPRRAVHGAWSHGAPYCIRGCIEDPFVLRIQTRLACSYLVLTL